MAGKLGSSTGIPAVGKAETEVAESFEADVFSTGQGALQTGPEQISDELGEPPRDSAGGLDVHGDVITLQARWVVPLGAWRGFIRRHPLVLDRLHW